MRTLPAYFIVLAIVILLTGAYDKFYYLTFTQSLFSGDIHTYQESWSLCIEEWFYLLVPLLIFLSFKLSSNKRKIFLFWIITIISIVTIYRSWVAFGIRNYTEFAYYLREPVTTRLDSIMYGVLCAYIKYYKPQIFKTLSRLFLVGVGLWVLLVLNYHISGFDFLQQYFTLTLEPLAAFLMIPYLSTIKTGRGVLFRFLTFTSLISYSLYLLNSTPVTIILNNDRVQQLMNAIPINQNFLHFGMYLTLSFAGAYISYKLIEKPFMDLRERKVRRRRPIEVKREIFAEV